jgi:hypothetical protein
MIDSTVNPVPPSSARRRVPAGAPLLVGRLVFTPGRRRSPPVLTWRGRCSFCGGEHCHGWPYTTIDLAQRTHRVGHCGGVDSHGRGYYLALDATFAAANLLAWHSYVTAMTEKTP